MIGAVNRRERQRLLARHAVLAGGIGATRTHIEHQCVIDKLEAVLLGKLLLAALDGLVEEFDDLSAIQAHHMIVVFFLGDLEHCMPAIEIVANDQSCGLELGQHAVDGGQTNVFTGFQQGLVDILGAKVMLARGILEDLQDLHSGQGDLQARLAQFMVLVGHVRSSQYQVGSGMIDRIHDSEEWTQMQKLIKTIPLVIALTMASGCVYKRDLPQGNYITEGMVQQLQPGMSRSQVVDLMGRPLLEAPFNANQWDYVFRLDEAYGGVQQRRLTLTFEGDRLVDMQREGDFARDIELRPQDDIGPAVEGASPMGDLPETQPQAAPEAAPDAGGTLPQGGEPATTEPLAR